MAANASIPEDPLAVVRSRRYLGLLVLTAILGVPISAAAYWFLWAVHHGQHWIFDTLPTLLGFETGPAWWPLPVLAMGGVIAGAAIAYLPGKGGHSPADGFKAGAPPRPAELPGVLLAALASLCFGAVVGPEGPLIALGSGLAALMLWLRKDPDQVIAVVGAAGAFAAVAFLLGSPIVGAFLMLEATGLTKPKAKVVLLPGLLCAGIGFLVALGLHSWTGVGKVSLTIANVPSLPQLTGAEFLWAIGFGIGAAVVGSAIRRLALLLRPHVEKRPVIMTPVAGLGIGALAIAYSQITGYGTRDVLFSGEESLPRLVQHAATCPVADSRAVDRLEEPGLQHFSEQLSGRAGFSCHLYRRDSGNPALAPARSGGDRGPGHGNSGDGGGHASHADDGCSSGNVATGPRGDQRDAAGNCHGGCRFRLC